jgi:hypothetical protein
MTKATIKPYYRYKQEAYQELVSFVSFILERVSPLYKSTKAMNEESYLMFSLTTKFQKDFVPKTLDVTISGSRRSAQLLQILLDSDDWVVLVNRGNGQRPEKINLTASEYSFVIKKFYELARVGEEIPTKLHSFVANHYSSQVSYFNDDSTLSVVAYASEGDLAYHGGISTYVLK